MNARRGFVPLVSLAVVVLAAVPSLGNVAGASDAASARSQIAMFDPAKGEWHIRYDDGMVESFYYGTPGDMPLMGDWDCDGFDTVAMFRPSNGFIYLRNSNTFGVADRDFFYGIGGDIPLAGDWDGDGCDTFAIYRPSEAKVYVSNRLGTNPADFSYFYGVPGDKPFSGDFDGDGVTTVGLYRDTTGYVYFRNTLTTGIADFDFYYGVPSDRILTGDWNRNGEDSVAIFRPSSQTFYLSYENRQGFADEELRFGNSSWLPQAGHFQLSPAVAARTVVLDQTGVPGAAPYTGSAPHPIVMLAPDGSLHPWNSNLPPQWRAGRLDALQLVAELETSDQLVKLETCTYTPVGTIVRWGYERTAIVYEARTAKRVTTMEILGSRPSNCPFTHMFDPSAREDWYGEAVTPADVRASLAGRVEADLTPPPTPELTDPCVVSSQVPGVNVSSARAFEHTGYEIDGDDRRLTVVGEVVNSSAASVGDVHLRVRYLDSAGSEIGYRLLELPTVLPAAGSITFREEVPTPSGGGEQLNTFPDGWATCAVTVESVDPVTGPAARWHVEEIDPWGSLWVTVTIVNDGTEPLENFWVALYDDDGNVVNVAGDSIPWGVDPGESHQFTAHFDDDEPAYYASIGVWAERP